MGGAAGVISTWFVQGENLFWPFQFHMVFTACLCAAAFYCLAKALTEQRSLYGIAALACAFVATFSFANGMFAWPLLITVCLLKGSKRLALLYTAGFALSLTLYLNGYVAPPHHANPVLSLEHKPMAVAYFLLVYLGHPFIALTGASLTPAVATSAAIIGLVGLLSCAGLVLHYVTRPKQEFEQHIYIPLMLWAVTTGLVTALGRINFPLSEVLSSRYVGVQLLFWYSLSAMLLLIVVRRRLFWPLLPAEIMGLIALACLLSYPSHRSMGDHYAALRNILNQEASAFYAGITDTPEWSPGLISTAPLAWDGLKRTRRGPFAFPEADLVGKNIGSLGLGTGCQGYLDQTAVTPDQHGVRVTGWAWNSNHRQVNLIALADINGKIVGWGATGSPRPDVVQAFNDPARARAGWVGYAPTPGPWRAFALSNDRQTACPLPHS
jgi:hypothetical protein